MDKMRAIWAVAAACAALSWCATGCGKAGTGAVEETAAALAQVAKTPEEEAKEAAEGALEALKAGRLETVYGMLPESWQGDLSRVAAAYAGKVEPELAKAAAETLAALGNAMEAQADNLSALAVKSMGQRAQSLAQWGGMPMDGMSAEEVSDGIRAAGGLLKGLVDFSYEKLAAGDLRGVLADSSASGLRLPVTGGDGESLRLAVRPAEATDAPAGDGGVAMMIGNDDDGWKRVDLRKVEGRWVPAELADEWRGAMDAALAKAAEFEIPEKEAARAKQFLSAVARMAEGLAGAKSPEELEGQLQGMMMGAVMMMGIPLD